MRVDQLEQVGWIVRKIVKEGCKHDNNEVKFDALRDFHRCFAVMKKPEGVTSRSQSEKLQYSR